MSAQLFFPFFLRTLIAISAVAVSQGVPAAEADVGIIGCTPQHLDAHNPQLAISTGRQFCFEGYISDFNTDSKRVGNKKLYFGVPYWVAHHIKRASNSPESNERPSAWFTIPELSQQKIAPTDASYQFSATFRKSHPDWFERGHLAQKYLLERVSAEAAWFTHSVANAVPQRGQFNKRTWLTLECYTGAWANKYGEVWVVTGPVYKKAVQWLRSDKSKGATPVAIPVALFKIVAKKTSTGWEAVSFVMPQTHASYAKKGPYDPAIWFKSIAEIERITGRTFMPNMAATAKDQEATKLWAVSASDFDDGCKAQRTTIAD